MINHFRTLLMNVDGSAPQPQYLADAIVDPTYKAVTLSAALRTLRAALFGSQPDRTFLNFRCAQLLALVHATPLAEFVTARDPRITYDPFAAPLYAATSVPVVSPIGLGNGTLTFFGTPDAPDVLGRSEHRLHVQTTSDTTVRISRQTTPFSNLVFTFDPATKLDLLGTGFQFRIAEARDGQDWLVDAFFRPQRSVAALAQAAENLGEPVYLELFGPDPKEPQLSWRNLWFHGRELPSRLAALTCALAYATEAQR